MKLLESAEFAKLVKGGGAGAVEGVVKRHTAAVVRAEGKPLCIAISSQAVDRDLDTIALGGWKLDAYRANPQVLWMHDRYSPPVATSKREWIENGKLMSEPEFTPKDLHPFGAMVGDMVKAGFLNTASVGFKPLKWVFDEERGGVDFLEQELREYSIVTIPANPEASVARAKAAGIDVAPLAEWAERVLEETRGKGFWVARATLEGMFKLASPERTVSIPVPVSAPAPAPGPTKDELAEAVSAAVDAGFNKLRTALTGRLD